MPTLTATDLGAVADADLVVLLTASADSLLGARAPRARCGRARRDPAAQHLPDPARAAAGRRSSSTAGVVDIPSLRVVGGDIGLPDGRAYACFAETAMLALTGHRGHFAIGAPGLDLVDRTRELAAGPGPPRVHPVRAHLLRPPGRRRRGRPRRGRGMTRIVLVGGGYVTIHAYAAIVRRLRRRLARGEVEVVVVTADPSHSFHGFTGEVLAGILPFERTRTPVAEACPLARVVHARVTGVDRGRHTVTYVPATGGPAVDLRWDHLVIGTGSREPAARVPGLSRHGYLLRAPGDIERLSARIAAAARPGPADQVPTVVVAGGGVAGVELAAAVADRGQGLVRVELVHSGGTLVPELAADQPRLARRVTAELDRLGVVVHRDTRLVEVTPTTAVLSTGRVVETTTVIGTIGQRPVPLPGLGDGLRDLHGRLTTGPDLCVVDGVWAAGDAARVAHPSTGDPVPANALWAIKAGHHVGVNVARTVRGQDDPPVPLPRPGPGRLLRARPIGLRAVRHPVHRRRGLGAAARLLPPVHAEPSSGTRNPRRHRSGRRWSPGAGAREGRGADAATSRSSSRSSTASGTAPPPDAPVESRVQSRQARSASPTASSHPPTEARDCSVSG